RPGGGLPAGGRTAAVSAGSPGEWEAQFEQPRRVCESAAFSKIHVFPYSPRSGTLAARWPDDVSPAEKERRCRLLAALSDRQGCAFAGQHLGEELEVLVETRSRHTGLWSGLTDNYLRVEFESEQDLHGRFV